MKNRSDTAINWGIGLFSAAGRVFPLMAVAVPVLAYASNGPYWWITSVILPFAMAAWAHKDRGETVYDWRISARRRLVIGTGVVLVAFIAAIVLKLVAR